MTANTCMVYSVQRGRFIDMEHADLGRVCQDSKCEGRLWMLARRVNSTLAELNRTPWLFRDPVFQHVQKACVCTNIDLHGAVCTASCLVVFVVPSSPALIYDGVYV